MRGRALLLAAAICALALPLVIRSDFWIGFCITVLLSTLTGTAWNILGGYGGQVSFGHAAFFGTGAYTAALLAMKFGVNAWIAFAAAAPAAGAVGLVIGYLSFRSGLRGSYFALITLAFAEVLRIGVGATDFAGGGVGLYVPLHVGAANLQFAGKAGYYYVALGLAAGAILIGRRLAQSRLGAWLVAIRENEDAARALGADTLACKMKAITLSAALTGLGGAFYADYYLYLDPSLVFGPNISVEVLLAPIIGGVGTVWGPFAGAVGLQTAAELSRRAFGDVAGLSLVLYGMLLVLMIKFRPDGLIGLFERLARPRALHDRGMHV
jgi:branched-chain amino acid transport system permease protein